MKIVHVVWGLTYGGIETMLVNIANAQSNMGADIHVVIINDLYDDMLIESFDDRVTVHLMHRRYKSKGLLFAVRMNLLLIGLSPDFIHLHSSRFMGMLWCKRLSRVASVTLHDLPTGSVRRSGILPKLLPILNLSNGGNVTWIDKVPRVFAISQAVQDELICNYGIESVVVYNGIKTKSFCKREAKRFDGKLHIIQVSRLEHNKKGQDLLIEAVNRLQGLVMVDFIGDGSSRKYLENLVEEKGLQMFVRFHGTKTQSYISEHLADYDLFVQPSRYEGFGLTVAEAMAANVPVLVSSGQGPAEVTCDNIYGWVFENGSVEDLVCKIKYIQDNYGEAIEKANKAREFIKDNYDISVTARRYLELYKKVTSKMINM